MKMFKALAVTALVAATTSAMAYDEKVVTEEGVATFATFKPAMVRAEVGTTGYGGAIGWSVNPSTGIVLGYNGGNIKWTDKLSVNGTDYDLDMNNKTAYLNAQIRPFSNWLYVAAGVGYLDNDYDITSKVGADNHVTVDGTRYHTIGSTTADIKGKLKYNEFAPYLGLGVSPAITNRFGLFGEIGAYYTGNPDVSFQYDKNLVPNQAGDRSITTAINSLTQSIRDDNKYKYLPVAKVGISARF